MDPQAIQAIKRRCTRYLAYHHPTRPKQTLTALAAATDERLRGDHYGAGELIEGFEKRIADLLGKAAAVFMPSGTMAQQIALRLWADRRGHPHRRRNSPQRWPRSRRSKSCPIRRRSI
jgi:hypothetical protein